MAAQRSGGVTTHRIQRSLAAMTVLTLRAYEERHRRDREIAGREAEQQFKFQLGGYAANEIAWNTLKIRFQDHFSVAQDRRNSTFTEPHMRFGYELLSPAPVMVTAHVAGWDKDLGDQMVIGCNVRIGVGLPGAWEPVRYSAVLHVAFQGWAVPQLNEDEVS